MCTNAMAGPSSVPAPARSRPRTDLAGETIPFALTLEEAHRLTNLLAIDRLLTELFGEAAAWLKPALRSSTGKKPLDHKIQEGQRGDDAGQLQQGGRGGRCFHQPVRHSEAARRGLPSA